MTVEHIRELLALIRGRGLLIPAAFREDLELLAQVYNGLGPERWPERCREWATRALSHYEPEALIHYWEYIFQSKTYLNFTIANLRFAVNSIINAWHTHRAGKLFWYDAGCGVALALLCQLGGWQAFKTGKLPDNNQHQEDVK